MRIVVHGQQAAEPRELLTEMNPHRSSGGGRESGLLGGTLP